MNEVSAATTKGIMMSAATMTGYINPLSQGFLLCASIIIALGPQNLFILRQGLRRQHLFATALFSTLADVVLIAAGVGGLSTLISSNAILHAIFSLGGAAFLLWCGGHSLLNGCRRNTTYDLSSHTTTVGIQATIAATLCFSFLNPAAYFDTLVVIGSQSLFLSVDERLVFGVGAVLASAVWFFTLAYGASKLAVIFRSPIAWRTMDIVSGSIMLGVASTMLINAFFAS